MCMKSSEFSRRRWLAAGAALTLSPLAARAAVPALATPAAAPALATPAAASAQPTPAAQGRFAALSRPALPVREPGKAVLLAAARAGSRVVAVGERGLVALSDDDGQSWRQARTPSSTTLTAVHLVDRSTGWAIGHGGVILATQDGGENWVVQADGRQLAQLAHAAAQARSTAADPRAAASLKDAALLVTDGPDKPLLDLHFTDSQRGVVVGAYNLFFETSDGGRTWTSALDRLDNPKSQHLYAVRSRGDTWLLAGEQGLLFRSRDGGKTFQRLASPYAGSWFALAASHGLATQGEWFLAGLRGHVFRTTDDGDTWAAVTGAPPASFVSAAALPDGRVLLANQAGQIFIGKGAAALVALPVPNLPPLSQVLPLAGGDLLGLGLAGAMRLPGKPS